MALDVPYGVVGYTGRMMREVMAVAGGKPVLRVWDVGEECDSSPKVIFDFSYFGVLPHTVELARKHKSALVVGTTALREEHIALLHEVSAEIPVVQSFNFSIGIAIMAMILREYGPMLSDWNAEIAEMHHIHKKDAPSGTAILLEKALGRKVPMHSYRLGGLPGDHTAIFGNEGETLSISHHAINRGVFAIGAVKAAQFALTKKNGFYTFEDVIRAK